MNFTDAVKTCFKKYFTSSGRASRSEFWYWVLFVLLLQILANLILEDLSLFLSLFLFFPGLTVSIRRLHDVNMTAWWLLIAFIPLIGLLFTIYFGIKKGHHRENKYGEKPLH